MLSPAELNSLLRLAPFLVLLLRNAVAIRGIEEIPTVWGHQTTCAFRDMILDTRGGSGLLLLQDCGYPGNVATLAPPSPGHARLYAHAPKAVKWLADHQRRFSHLTTQFG